MITLNALDILDVPDVLDAPDVLDVPDVPASISSFVSLLAPPAVDSRSILVMIWVVFRSPFVLLMVSLNLPAFSSTFSIFLPLASLILF